MKRNILANFLLCLLIEQIISLVLGQTGAPPGNLRISEYSSKLSELNETVTDKGFKKGIHQIDGSSWIVAIFTGDLTQLNSTINKNERNSRNFSLISTPWHLVLAEIKTGDPVSLIWDFTFSAPVNQTSCNGVQFGGDNVYQIPIAVENDVKPATRRMQTSWEPHQCDIRGGIYGRYIPCMTPALAVSNSLDLVRTAITGNYPFPGLRAGRPFDQTVGWYN